MTREEMERALRRIVSEAGEVAKTPVVRPEIRVLASAVCLLATIVGLLMKDIPKGWK